MISRVPGRPVARSLGSRSKRLFSSFGSKTGVPLSTVITSRAVSASSSGAISITVGTGEYQINGGTWVSTPGTVVLGDLIRARLTSSGIHETAVSLEITINGVADTFTVTTHVEAVAELALTQAGELIMNQDGTYLEW